MIAEAMGDLSPGLVIILGAVLVPLLRGWLRQGWLLLLPVVAFVYVLGLEHGHHGVVTVFDLELTTIRVDRLSLVFGYIFLVALWLGVIYQLHVKGWMEHTAGLVYAGSAVGAVFAGDLVTLFLFWEGTAIASVFLVWASRTEAAYRAGMRYLVIQVGSGVLLLAGAMIHYGQTGSIAFGSFDPGSAAGLLIFLSFGIKCAFPLLHAWVKDAYPAATVTGTVVLSVFTTKLAVYALARGFAGAEILVPIGAVMAVFPILYALIENDLRRVLSYSLIIQLGFMVVGIGIGTELALAGAAAHAVGHILYKALLFMSIGAVLHRTGTARASELGGLYRTMPWTAGFCIVGAASISAFPLFSGFVSKALILASVLKEGHFWPWLALLLAGAASLHYVGIKVPFFAFFGRDSGLRPKEAPANMLVAMGIAAALSVGIGVLPAALYAMLPHGVGYDAYTVEHIVTQLQLLALSAAAFAVLMRAGVYPAMARATNLDVDWLYRRPVKLLAKASLEGALAAWGVLMARINDASMRVFDRLYGTHGPEGAMARTRPSGFMALWMTVLLALFLVLSFV